MTEICVGSFRFADMSITLFWEFLFCWHVDHFMMQLFLSLVFSCTPAFGFHTGMVGASWLFVGYLTCSLLQFVYIYIYIFLSVSQPCVVWPNILILSVYFRVYLISIDMIDITFVCIFILVCLLLFYWLWSW